MKLHLDRSLGLVLALLSTVPPLVAQTTGTISGRVGDGEGAALIGVHVSATSPSLPGQRVAATGPDGAFRMPGLPPGGYRVRAALAGFQTVEQADVILPIDREITLEFRLLPSFSEELTVHGSPPLLDVTSASVGTVVQRETFENLPIARTYVNLAFLAPGVVDSGGYDRGAPSIAGATSLENRVIVDRLDTTESGFGGALSTLPPEFLEAVEIKTGGLGPEYGGALGGIVNALTRSGSNHTRASLFGYYRDDGFGSDHPRSVRNDQFLGSRTYDYGGTLGGRIIRDRLWFFLGLNPVSRQDDWVTSQRLSVTDESEGLSYVGKLSWQVHPSHRLVASAFGDPGERTSHSTFAAGVLRGDWESRNHHFVLSYDAVPHRDLAMDLSAGRYDSNTTLSPAADRPWYVDATGGRFARAENCGDPELVADGMSFAPGCLGGTSVYDPLDGRRDELRGSATFSARTGRVGHEVRAGAILRRVKFKFNVRYPAAVPGPFYDSAGTLVDPGGLSGQFWVLTPDSAQLEEREPDGPGENDELGLFLQDEISIGSLWTLLLGLRADAFDSTGRRTDQDRSARLKFGLDEMLGPRVGLVWDPTGKGRSRVFAHYARYYESVPLWINTQIFGIHRRNFYTFRYPDDGSLPSAQDPGVLISSRSSSSNAPLLASRLDPQHTDETLLGFEYQIRQDLSVGLTAISRDVGDVLENFCIDDGATCFVGNPGGTLTRNPATGELLAAPVTLAEPERKYRALQLTFEKRLRGNWQLAGSYVYSKNEGNYTGLIQQDIGFSAPNLTTDFDRPELSQNANGPLPNDRAHQAKLYGSYNWSFGLVTGFFAQYATGTPLSRIGRHPYGRLRFVTPRGTAGRTPDLFTIDFRTEYPIRLAKNGPIASVFADVFNVADTQRPIYADQLWTFARSRTTEDPNECGGPGTGPGTDCPAGNPNWGKPILYHSPRTLRIGTRLTW